MKIEKFLTVLKVVLFIVIIGSVGTTYYLIYSQMRAGLLVDLGYIEWVYPLLAVALVSMIGFQLIASKERKKRWNDFFEPFKESFEREFESSWGDVDRTGVLADTDIAYFAVAIASFKKVWAENASEKKWTPGKSDVASELIAVHADKMGVSKEALAIIAQDIL